MDVLFSFYRTCIACDAINLWQSSNSSMANIQLRVAQPQSGQGQHIERGDGDGGVNDGGDDRVGGDR